MQVIEIAYNVSLAVMTVLSFVLTMIGSLAYRRTGNRKLLAITGAFFIFLIKGIWLSYSSFNYSFTEGQYVWLPVLILDTIILVMFYLSSLKR